MKHATQPPVYLQVAYDIAAKIVAGDLREGARFTGRSLMGTQYAVSSETIRRAMKLLADMQITEIRQNVGSVVLSRQRAEEYVEQYKQGKDLRAMRARLRQLTGERDRLNAEIEKTIADILDLTDRFRSSDQTRTYEFTIAEGCGVVDKTIGQLQFRQRTGATVVAVRHGESVLLSPGPQTVLSPGDVLVVAADLAGIGQVSELLSQPADR